MRVYHIVLLCAPIASGTVVWSDGICEHKCYPDASNLYGSSNLFKPTCSSPPYSAALDRLNNKTALALDTKVMTLVNTGLWLAAKYDPGYVYWVGTGAEVGLYGLETRDTSTYNAGGRVRGRDCNTLDKVSRTAIVLWTQELQDEVNAEVAKAALIIIFGLVLPGVCAGACFVAGVFVSIFCCLRLRRKEKNTALNSSAANDTGATARVPAYGTTIAAAARGGGVLQVAANDATTAGP